MVGYPSIEFMTAMFTNMKQFRHHFVLWRFDV